MSNRKQAKKEHSEVSKRKIGQEIRVTKISNRKNGVKPTGTPQQAIAVSKFYKSENGDVSIQIPEDASEVNKKKTKVTLGN